MAIFRTLVAAVVGLVVAGVAAGAVAAPIVTFQFTATATSINDPLNVLNNSFVVGNSFTGNYEFDSLAADGDARDTVGSYSIISATAPIGNQSITATSSSEISIFNDIPDFSGADRYHVVIRDFIGSPKNAFDFTLFDPGGNALTSDALPLAPPNLASFSSNSGVWRYYDASFNVLASANFTISSISIVPLPAAAWLFLTGLGLVGAAAWKRRRAE